MQLESGGDWPPPTANTMVKTQGTYITRTAVIAEGIAGLRVTYVTH
jgi:hypothetical protein